MARTSYAVALGSNRPSRAGPPADAIRTAAERLGVECLSAVRITPALGPAGRSFANAVSILTSPLDPLELLARLKELERDFGRRRGRAWGPRVLDLDIILWSGGAFAEAGLTIPHPAFRERRFVLDPLTEIAPGWRDPVTGLSVRQLRARLARANPVDQPLRKT